MKTFKDTGKNEHLMGFSTALCRRLGPHRNTGERFFFITHPVRTTLLRGHRFEQSQTAFPDDALMLHSESSKTCWGAAGRLQLFMENNLQGVFSDGVTLLSVLITMAAAEAERSFSPFLLTP